MRIRNYVVRPDTCGWIVARIKKNAKTGEEYEADHKYPGRYDQALRCLLDRMVADGAADVEDLSEAVATVAHLYSTIGRYADAQSALTEVGRG